jgi:hypothetical protein
MVPCSQAKLKSGDSVHEGTPNADSSSSRPAPEGKKSSTARAFGRLPLYFIANRGQVNRQVAFYETGSGHATFFTRKGIVLDLEKRESPREPRGGKTAGKKAFAGKTPARRGEEARSACLGIGMVGMNKDVQILPEQPQSGKVNYILGSDPRKWRTNIPTCKAVLYRNAYPGIDIRFYGNNRRLEYDVIVKPGADPSRVRFRYSGAQDVRVVENGDLAVDFAGGAVIQQKPVVYQMVAGKRVARSGAFLVREDHRSPRAAIGPHRPKPSNLHLRLRPRAL